MLALIKTALRITTSAFDDELNMLINACIQDLNASGIVGARVSADTSDDLVRQAIVAFCKWRFGDNPNADKMRELYELQKAQLATATNYTEWG